ncbi:hypothetical protein [Azohydromonas caseinilytica]|uniref:Chemotaxis protein n=1 Tax=Azohydromonas caseinilytica TaxID=2728836 RepID=A0A848F0G2_9BURK|nr:hypothetical protein [Azohydromonas caseinilytica]NML13547.1 hypothetical protein [Azohydromonas caseinilytica]
MATSSILGPDQTPVPVSGRDTAALGPSDTTDSGSDIAGLEDDLNPGGTLDSIAEPDSLRPMSGPEALSADSDSQGTGERRSAGSDAGNEAADIAPDSIQTVGDIDTLVDGDFNGDASAGMSPEEARAREDAAADMVNASTLEDDDDLEEDLDEEEEADANVEDDEGLDADDSGDVPDLGDAGEDDEEGDER